MTAYLFLIYGGQGWLCGFTGMIVLRTGVVSWPCRTLFIEVDF